MTCSRVSSARPWRKSTPREAPRRRHARSEPRRARQPGRRALRRHLAHRARGEDQALRARARDRAELLADEPRGGLRRAPAQGRRERRRADPEPGRLDALLMGDPRRARGGRPPGGRGASLRGGRARGVAPDLRDPRPMHRLRPGQGRRWLPRGARAAEGAGRVSTARADRLVELLRERELDSLLVTNLVNVRYLTGFTGTNGACVITPDQRLFLTDFRYVERAENEVHGFERLRAGPNML